MNVLFTNKLDMADTMGSRGIARRRVLRPLRQATQVLVMQLLHTAPLTGGLLAMIALRMLPLRRIIVRKPIERTSRRRLLARRMLPLAQV